jgi:hypothetical protein
VVGELHRRLPVAPTLSLRVLPEPSTEAGEVGVRILLSNRGDTPADVAWEAAVTAELSLAKGSFGPPQEPTLAFPEPASGTAALGPGESKSILLAMPGADPERLYRVNAKASGGEDSALTVDRLVGGFVGVARASKAPNLDGKLDDRAWQPASPVKVEGADGFRALQRARKPPTGSWEGPDDLSATARFLWDDEFLYLGVEVRDDIAGGLKSDDQIWSQDGLQFLIDPAREAAAKPGKYDYAVAVGAKGPQAWAYHTADSTQAPVGEVTDIRVAAHKGDAGNVTYEIAIPWNRISPFRAEAGANLGFTLILNEDDGKGRDSFLTWFGDAHTKQVATAGDLILLPGDLTRSTPQLPGHTDPPRELLLFLRKEPIHEFR